MQGGLIVWKGLRRQLIAPRECVLHDSHPAIESALLGPDRAPPLVDELSGDLTVGLSSARTIAAVEKLARSDRRLAATVAQWDADPWLLIAGPEALDLRTGIGRAPDAFDYATRAASCAAAPPDTPHPLWSEFLDRVTGHNTDLQAFLRRYIGYALTGLTAEHAFAFAHGGGANGKTTRAHTHTVITGEPFRTLPAAALGPPVGRLQIGRVTMTGRQR